MKFELPEHSLFAVLLRKDWWVSIAIAAGLAGVAMALLPEKYRVAGALGAFPFVVIGVIAAVRQKGRPGRARLDAIQAHVATLSWAEFGPLIEQSFSRQGYVGRPCPQPGADLILERQGRRKVVCAKRWKSARLSLEAIRALQDARDATESADALFLCLGEPTEDARTFAASYGIDIWRADALGALLHPVLSRHLGADRGA